MDLPDAFAKEFWVLVPPNMDDVVDFDWDPNWKMFELANPFVPFVSIAVVLLSSLSLPLVAVDLEPKLKDAGTVVADELLLWFPNTNPCPVVVLDPPFSLPFAGLLKKEKLLPPDGAALNPPKPAKTLGAPS